MIRNINMNSIGLDSSTISSHKDSIRTHIEGSGYDLNDWSVNDGKKEDGSPTLGVNTKFNKTSDATSFHTFLKGFLNNNSSDFSWARISVHDCEHNTNGNLPCSLGDVWTLGE